MEKALTYYNDDDYMKLKQMMPNLVEQAKMKACEVMEPTVSDIESYHKTVMEYVCANKRKIYGGMALHYLLKSKNGEGIYKRHEMGDVEFYSFTPVKDLIEICNLFYSKYKDNIPIQGKEGEHPETYKVFVNFTNICDITYVPKRVYAGIPVIVIDNAQYVDPHFMLIDHLRIFTNPLQTASYKWEKQSCRTYHMLTEFPLPYYKPDSLKMPSEVKKAHNNRVKHIYHFVGENMKNTCLLTGYYSYINFAKESRYATGAQKVPDNYFFIPPYVEIISINYADDVIAIYNNLKENIKDPSRLSIKEFFPLFQFTLYSLVILYDDQPVAKIYESNGLCVPYIIMDDKYIHTSFQFLLKHFLIEKFNSFLMQNKVDYFNYGVLISNLMVLRNIYYKTKKMPPVNSSIYSDFIITCIGSTVNSQRQARLRFMELNKRGKRPFCYVPSFNIPVEIPKTSYKNTSGNEIFLAEYQLFSLDDNMDIHLKIVNEENANIEETEDVIVGGAVEIKTETIDSDLIQIDTDAVLNDTNQAVITTESVPFTSN